MRKGSACVARRKEDGFSTTGLPTLFGHQGPSNTFLLLKKWTGIVTKFGGVYVPGMRRGVLLDKRFCCNTGDSAKIRQALSLQRFAHCLQTSLLQEV